MLDASGRLVLFEQGCSDGIDRRLRNALKRDKSVSDQITLSMAMSEVEDVHHKPMEKLPKADPYITDCSADWYEPCQLLARNLELFLLCWKGVQVVWLKIDADPLKVR